MVCVMPIEDMSRENKLKWFGNNGKEERQDSCH